MKFYAVIDTNVIVAALLSRKKDVATVKVLKAVQEGLILPLVHQQIIDEYKEVLCRPKFHLPRHLTDSITEQLRAIGIFLDRTPSNENFPDPKDGIKTARHRFSDGGHDFRSWYYTSRVIRDFLQYVKRIPNQRFGRFLITSVRRST